MTMLNVKYYLVVLLLCAKLVHNIKVLNITILTSRGLKVNLERTEIKYSKACITILIQMYICMYTYLHFRHTFKMPKFSILVQQNGVINMWIQLKYFCREKDQNLPYLEKQV